MTRVTLNSFVVDLEEMPQLGSEIVFEVRGFVSGLEAELIDVTRFGGPASEYLSGPTDVSVHVQVATVKEQAAV